VTGLGGCPERGHRPRSNSSPVSCRGPHASAIHLASDPGPARSPDSSLRTAHERRERAPGPRSRATRTSGLTTTATASATTRTPGMLAARAQGGSQGQEGRPTAQDRRSHGPERAPVGASNQGPGRRVLPCLWPDLAVRFGDRARHLPLPTAPTTTPSRTGTSMALTRCSPAARNRASSTSKMTCSSPPRRSRVLLLRHSDRREHDGPAAKGPQDRSGLTASPVAHSPGGKSGSTSCYRRLGDPVDSVHRPVMVGAVWHLHMLAFR
jgi:hypothetical protein